MDILARARNILLSPATEWPAIAAEATDSRGLYIGYILPMAALPPVVMLAVDLLLFRGLGFHAAVLSAVVSYLLNLLSVMVLALIAAKLAPAFGGRDSIRDGLKLIGFSMTAGWVGVVFIAIPVIGGILSFAAGLYGLYLLYLGVSPVMGIRPEKSLLYAVVVIAAAIVAMVLIRLILGLG